MSSMAIRNGHFEPVEGQLNFTHRDILCNVLRQNGIKVEGRLLFGFINGLRLSGWA